MNDILSQLPPLRDMPAGRAELRRIALEQTARGRPRRRHTLTRPRFLVPAGAAVAAAVAVAVAVMSGVLNPQPAYASWTEHPSALDPAETSKLGVQCRSHVQKVFPQAASDLRPVLGERRGTFQTALIASGRQLALCADWLGTQVGGTVRGSQLNGLAIDVALEPGHAVNVVANPGQTNGPDAARISYGLVSPAVTKVVVTTKDGRRVTASVSNGYFLAWWPSGADTADVEAFDAAGQSLARVK